MKYISYILVLLTTFSLSSCFTGIESTPKINSSDVIKQKAEDTATPETELAKQMTALPLPEWTAEENTLLRTTVSALYSIALRKICYPLPVIQFATQDTKNYRQ